ncbi:MAG: transglycosylase SLT domain-containing protein [Methylococcales bacterium]
MYRNFSIRFALLLGLLVFARLPGSSFGYDTFRSRTAVVGSDVFPDPPGLRDAVQFWQHVFGVWRENQIVFHDDEYLGAVYEVVQLPPWWSPVLSPEQTDYIQHRREVLKSRLAALEGRLRNGLALDADMQILYDVIVRAGGKFAVFGASERVRQQRGMRERFLDGLRTSGRYDAHIREVFRQARLPEDLAYLPHIESSFINNSRSQAGAAGAWQFMRSTGELYMMINEAIDERFDPIFAARGAARYLSGAYRRLGDWGLAITSYNHGINGMAAARDQYGRDIGKIVRNYKGRLFGFASRNFYAEFLAVRSIIANLDQYFPGGVRLDPPLDHARVRLLYAASLMQLAGDYRVGAGFLESLNPALTRSAINGRVPLPAGSELWLPRHTVANPDSVTIYARKPVPVPVARPVPRERPDRMPKQIMLVAAKSPAPPKKKAEPKARTHRVRKGESLYGIANRYGVQVATLMAFNDLRRPNLIRAGQQLRIPVD